MSESPETTEAHLNRPNTRERARMRPLQDRLEPPGLSQGRGRGAVPNSRPRRLRVLTGSIGSNRYGIFFAAEQLTDIIGGTAARLLNL